MRLISTAIATIGLLFLLAPLIAMSAPQRNDFTSANSSINKRFISNNSKFSEQDKDTPFQSKKFTAKTLSESSEKARIQNQKANLYYEDDASRLTKEKFYRDGEKYQKLPDYRDTSKKYIDNTKSYKNDNIGRDMSKPYKGDFDWARRNHDMQKSIDDFYKSTEEKSMGDVNKYFFREGRNESDVDTIKAGADIHPEQNEGGFWDFLSRDKNIRSKVSLKGKRTDKISAEDYESEKLRAQKQREAESAARTESLNRTESDKNPQTLTVSPVKVKSFSAKNSDTKKQKAPSAPINNMHKVSEQEIAPDKAQQFRFLNVPEEFRGKATIKVEIKDD